jgi:hypothetical protein
MATAVIIDKKDYKVSSITPVSYGLSRIVSNTRDVKINSFLPFRVSFSTITIPGYSPNSPAPIGIAVIGFNNYIL